MNSTANRNGLDWENTVAGILRPAGYPLLNGESVPTAERTLKYYQSLGQKGFVRKLTLGGFPVGNFETDFCVLGASAFPKGLILECKTQQGPGSAYVKMAANARLFVEGPVPGCIVFHGKIGPNAAKPSWVDWIRSMAGQGNFYGFFELHEFALAINGGLLI